MQGMLFGDIEIVRRYLVSYFIILYVINTVFVFLLSVVFGDVRLDAFMGYVPISVAYVLPYSLINFVAVGIVSSYLLKGLLKDRRTWSLFPLIGFMAIDVVFFRWYFNNHQTTASMIRIGFFLLSFLILIAVEKRRIDISKRRTNEEVEI